MRVAKGSDVQIFTCIMAKLAVTCSGRDAYDCNKKMYFLIEELILIQLTKNVYTYVNKKSKKYYVYLFGKKF